MAQDKRWDMETAARLLQYGATGKAVAEAVGCLPSEISRHKDTLLSMVVDPLTQNEADKLLRKWKPVEMAKPTKPQTELVSKSTPVTPAPMPPQQIEETQTAPVVLEPRSEEEKAATLHRKPDIVVDIRIGKGVVHLEAENARVLETLINMLVAMGGRE